jgi:hypothetical protein
MGTLILSSWREAQLHGFDCRDTACLARGSPCARARKLAHAYDFFAPHVMLALAAVRHVGRAHAHIKRQEAAFLHDLDSLLLRPSQLPVPLTQSFLDAAGPRNVHDALLADGGAALAVLRDAAQALAGNGGAPAGAAGAPAAAGKPPPRLRSTAPLLRRAGVRQEGGVLG